MTFSCKILCAAACDSRTCMAAVNRAVSAKPVTSCGDVDRVVTESIAAVVLEWRSPDSWFSCRTTDAGFKRPSSQVLRRVQALRLSLKT